MTLEAILSVVMMMMKMIMMTMTTTGRLSTTDVHAADISYHIMRHTADANVKYQM